MCEQAVRIAVHVLCKLRDCRAGVHSKLGVLLLYIVVRLVNVCASINSHRETSIDSSHGGRR